MRVLIDTNVLVSSSLNAKGTPYKAYAKAVTAPNEALVCEKTVAEFHEVAGGKLCRWRRQMERFLAEALAVIELVRVPFEKNALEGKIRDEDDRPILRAALAARADAILTGDKDFLEAGLAHPLVLDPASFLRMP